MQDYHERASCSCEVILYTVHLRPCTPTNAYAISASMWVPRDSTHMQCCISVHAQPSIGGWLGSCMPLISPFVITARHYIGRSESSILCHGTVQWLHDARQGLRLHVLRQSDVILLLKCTVSLQSERWDRS